MPITRYSTLEIASWLTVGSTTVLDISLRPNFWQTAEMPREELLSLIRQAGGVSSEYALEAYHLPWIPGEPRRTVLLNGCHRWRISKDLEYAWLPVDMHND